MEKEKVMSWVQKLMTKAMHPNTPKHEVEACELKAAEFMAKYKITMIQATQSQESSDPFKGLDNMRADFIGEGRSDWGYYLAFGIARAFDCKSIAESYRNQVCFLGYVDDIDTCKWFFEYLQIEIYLWAEKFSRLKKEQNSYAHGMVNTIEERLTSLYKRVEEIIPSDCRDLIVIKKKVVKDFAKHVFPRTRPKARNKMKFDAFSQGMKDGKNLDLANHNRAKVNEQAKLA